MTLTTFKKDMAFSQGAFWLYLAVFSMACSGGVYMTSLPFILKNIGAADTSMGLCLSLGFAGYLFGCLCGRSKVDRFNPKSIVLAGSGTMTVIVILLWCVLWGYQQGVIGGYAFILVSILAASVGLTKAMFWPLMMGWIATGFEGKGLNRRLAFYNMSWSIGLVISPYLGGLLTEINDSLAILATILFVGSSFVLSTFATHPDKAKSKTVHHSSNIQEEESINVFLGRFRLMSHIAMVCIFVCMGLFKTQLAVLFKLELGFSESQYGLVMTINSIVTWLVFVAISKHHTWHYKLWPFLVAQGICIIGMVMILYSSTLWMFAISAGLVGLSRAFIVISNQFYGASGRKKRLAAMAIHEVLLSVGYIFGFVAGGFLADHFGRIVAPYIFGLVVVCTGLIAQTAIWFWAAIRCQKRERGSIKPVV